MGRPYRPEFIDCLRATLQQIEQGADVDDPQIQDLKRRILLLLADLKDHNGEKCLVSPSSINRNKSRSSEEERPRVLALLDLVSDSRGSGIFILKQLRISEPVG